MNPVFIINPMFQDEHKPEEEDERPGVDEKEEERKKKEVGVSPAVFNPA